MLKRVNAPRREEVIARTVAHCQQRKMTVYAGVLFGGGIAGESA